MAIAYKISSLAIGLLGLIACTANHSEQNLRKLTGDKGTKYWDLIYQTDIHNKYYNQLTKSGKPETCIKFQLSGKVVHYTYLDSLNVIDKGCNTDISFNPDNYTLESDSVLSFGGRTYIIDAISSNFMVLRFGFEKKKYATFIYSVSKIQNKKVFLCKPI